MSKHKMNAPHFIFHKGQMHLYPFVYFHFHSTDLLIVETIFKMNLNTPVTKYTDISIFNFAPITYPQTTLVTKFAPIHRAILISSAAHNVTLNVCYKIRNSQEFLVTPMI